METYDVNNTLIQLVMVIKVQELLRSEVPTLRYDNLEDYLNDCLWKNGCPKTLHEAANQILSVEAKDIVRFLARRAMYQYSAADLNDFTDLIGR